MEISQNIDAAVLYRINDKAPEWAWCTTAEITRRLGLSKNTLKAWRTGANEPSISKIMELCDLLNIRPIYIFQGTYPIGTEDDGLVPDIPKGLTQEQYLSLQAQILKLMSD